MRKRFWWGLELRKLGISSFKLSLNMKRSGLQPAPYSSLYDYLDGGDHVRRGFLPTPDASSCLVCSSSMSSNHQHVLRLCSMSSLDAVFRSLQAVVLIFFLLMDSFLLVFDPSAMMNQS
ncbi:hypothetical protein P692DRAFT_2017749 [Suillus brevipes Sb2]|nr:hypothetical protein P692DRAFT_2017749 [Suillus brevipes Sb2]